MNVCCIFVMIIEDILFAVNSGRGKRRPYGNTAIRQYGNTTIRQYNKSAGGLWNIPEQVRNRFAGSQQVRNICPIFELITLPGTVTNGEI